MSIFALKVPRLERELAEITNQWEAWTPTLTWATATPINITTIFNYKQVGKTIFCSFKVSSTDANGTTYVRMTLPVMPKTKNSLSTLSGSKALNGNYSSTFLRVRDDGVNNDLYTIFLGATTIGQTLLISCDFYYEVD